jgi:magnesium transporter
VNPLYYVTFTTATLCASFILFSGFNTTDAVNTLSLLCGFLVTFTGVYLLNLSRHDPNGHKLASGRSGEDATGTDMISSLQTRLSMQSRRSGDPGRHSMGSIHGDREGLIRAYDAEEAAGFGLTDLASDSDGEGHQMNGNSNGNGKARHDDIELEGKAS